MISTQPNRFFAVEHLLILFPFETDSHSIKKVKRYAKRDREARTAFAMRLINCTRISLANCLITSNYWAHCINLGLLLLLLLLFFVCLFVFVRVLNCYGMRELDWIDALEEWAHALNFCGLWWRLHMIDIDSDAYIGRLSCYAMRIYFVSAFFFVCVSVIHSTERYIVHIFGILTKQMRTQLWATAANAHTHMHMVYTTSTGNGRGRSYNRTY